jgi:hypothetical protein
MHLMMTMMHYVYCYMVMAVLWAFQFLRPIYLVIYPTIFLIFDDILVPVLNFLDLGFWLSVYFLISTLLIG